MLLAVPIPEAAATEGAVIQAAIDRALSDAEARGIAGAQVRMRAHAHVCCMLIYAFKSMTTRHLIKQMFPNLF